MAAVKKNVFVSPTKFMQELKDKMIYEKKLGESTANSYIAILTRLNGGKMFTTLGFLKADMDAVVDQIKEKELDNKVTHLSAILAALYTFRETPQYKKYYKEYQTMLNDLLGEKDERRVETENKKSEKQADNWVTWDEVMKKYEGLRKDVLGFKVGNHITKGQYTDLIQCLLLSLYTEIEPRRNLDYLNMYIKMDGPRVAKGGAGIDENEHNILDLKENQFYFRVYKTAKFYGLQKINIPDELRDIINVWLRYHPSLSGLSAKPKYVRFLVNADGTIPRANFITLKMNQIFKSKVSTSMLRHIFITEKFGPEMEEMSRVAAAMGHSVAEQRDYAKFD